MTKRRVGPVIAMVLSAFVASTLFAPSAAADDVLRCNEARPYHDLNGDGYEDAVVGDPYATVNGELEAGTVTVLFGDADGRIGEGARQVLTQTDVGETPEAGDHFGWTVLIRIATDANGCEGVLIGAPGEDIESMEDAGMAHAYIFNAGLEANEPQFDATLTWVQSDVAGTVEAGDEFGYSIDTLGGRDENGVVIAFGAPGENNDAGVINHTGGRSIVAAMQWRQGSRGVPGVFQAGDRFGEVLCFCDLNGVEEEDADWYLYVGAPGDVVDGKLGAGSVTALTPYSKPYLITQNSPGVPGVAESGDAFGMSLARSWKTWGSTLRQLAIGAPGEDLGTIKDAGTVTVLKRVFTGGSVYGRGLPTVALSQSTPGVTGTAERGDRFGSAIAYRDDRTLAIGTPGEDLGAVVDAGSVHIVRVGRSHLSFPSPTITEDSAGTPGSVQAGSRFGSSVTGVRAVTSNPAGLSIGEGLFAITSTQDGGSVYVLSTDPAIAPRYWKPGSGGIPGVGVGFGRSVA